MKNNKSHPGNPSGLRGTGSKKRVGATVKRLELSDEVARSVRIICSLRFGDAKKDTVQKYVSELILADWQEWDKKIEADAESALEGEIMPHSQK